MFRRSEYVSSCTFYIPCGTLYGCASKGLHQVQPFETEVKESFNGDGQEGMNRLMLSGESPLECCNQVLSVGDGLGWLGEEEQARGAEYMQAADLDGR